MTHSRPAIHQLLDDAFEAKLLHHSQDQIRRRHPLLELTDQAHPHDLRREHVDRLTQHDGLGLDPADAPAEDSKAVHHGGV